MMNFIICSITKKSKIQDTVLGRSTFYNDNKDSFYIELNNNGKKGLCEFYNECIKKFGKEKNIIIFCHDDVELISSDILYQVSKGLERFDVIGVAGCINPKIKEFNLWHLMTDNKTDLRGFAGHPYNENCGDSFYVTSFGPTPSRVALIDGVFMAVKPEKLLKTNTFFDEQFYFHHYDLDFCLTCNKNKLKIGVWPILINHQSPGLADMNISWTSSNTKFINKWKNK